MIELPERPSRPMDGTAWGKQMEVVFLGTAGYHPNETRHTSCVMIPEMGIVLDAGTGFFRVRQHLRATTLTILLSHLHLDHVDGLTYLLDVLWEKPVEAVTIHGPPGVEYLRHGLFETPLFPLPLTYRVSPVPEEDMEIAGARVTARLLPHPGGSLAYRLDWPDRSLAYVTDTTASLDYAEFVRGVDLLIHECAFPDRMEARARETGHSWTSAVSELALAAGAKRLILTHTNPLDPRPDPVELDAARVCFPGVVVAHDGMAVVV